MMSKTDRPTSDDAPLPGSAETDADWRQLEAFVQQLHELAHAPIEAQEFYQQLLGGCVTLLAASGGVVWLPGRREEWHAAIEINSQHAQSGETASATLAQAELLRKVAASSDPVVIPPRSRGVGGAENPLNSVLACVAVQDDCDRTCAIVELWLRSGSGPEAQQGWRELLKTVSQIASQFHVHEQLRKLREEHGNRDQSLALLQRFQHTADLRQTAFAIANEGRRFVGADRLSIVIQRGKTWQLLAASGVDRIETRADAAKQLQLLAKAVAAWGEPLEYADAASHEATELPPELMGLAEQHVDQSQARQLVAVPFELVDRSNAEKQSRMPGRDAAVVIAEQFRSGEGEFSLQRVLELAELCQPALTQAVQLDRFPVRQCLRWADRWTEVRDKLGLTKLTLAGVAVVAVLLALIFVRCDFEVSAPATLRPLVERDIFATTDGQVVDVKIAHGDRVKAGDVLAVLADPQLSLDAQRVTGEIATTRKRLEAIAVARTDRQVREEATTEKLPLAAEAEQLEKQLVSLMAQQEILANRQQALTLRSPISGTVLTLDVQNLLRTRPVERGQILFTVADSTAGWQLVAEMPQDRLGHVLTAQQELGEALPTRFRLTGDTETIYQGQVASISTVAVLDPASLDQESPELEVVIEVNEPSLRSARPGMNAQVRIHCGRRSLGYVWLHDIWEAVYSWIVF